MNVNFPGPKILLLSAFAIVSTALAIGCDSEESATSNEPLRPLIYTEHPELTPEGAAVREERIMRRLVEGAQDGGTWGALDEEASAVDLADADALGETIFSALVERDAAAWDAVFVPASDYAALVHVEMDAAREFVDEAQGSSRRVWKLFEPEPPSAAVAGGYGAVYRLVGLELGEGRTVGGKIAQGEEPVAQHWGNVLRLAWRGTEQVFEVRIPKILRVRRAGETTLRVASPMQADGRMALMHAVGMHLKPELLRAAEYPYPLQVGNFWRYRRYRGEQRKEVDPFEAGLTVESTAPDAGVARSEEATEALDEVMSIDRYGTWRLVRVRRSYNDTQLTKEDAWWLVMPRRIYLCIRACRNNIEDAAWLLTYIDQQTPIYVFPLRGGAAWGVGGRDGDTFRTTAVESVETPAGVFDGVVRIEGSGPLGTFDPTLAARQTRDVVWGQGLVRREIFDRKGLPVTEELVEHRVR